jgi:hypothetical protein
MKRKDVSGLAFFLNAPEGNRITVTAKRSGGRVTGSVSGYVRRWAVSLLNVPPTPTGP